MSLDHPMIPAPILRATRHTITTKIPVRFRPAWADDVECLRPTVEITYSCADRRADDAPELILISATLIDGDGLDLTDQDVRERAQDWLDDEGYDAACQHAEGQS